MNRAALAPGWWARAAHAVLVRLLQPRPPLRQPGNSLTLQPVDRRRLFYAVLFAAALSLASLGLSAGADSPRAIQTVAAQAAESLVTRLAGATGSDCESQSPILPYPADDEESYTVPWPGLAAISCGED